MQLSHIRLFGIPWTVAYQAPLSMEFSRQEYWSGCVNAAKPGAKSNPGAVSNLTMPRDHLEILLRCRF